mgnify:FL=1
METKVVKMILDKELEDFFPQKGSWKISCFSKSKKLEWIYLPCHIRDNDWLAKLILKKYDLKFIEKQEVLNYLTTSEQFNKSRHDYEQRIVNWQINWMRNGGEDWLVDKKLGGDLYIFSPKCDYAFRKGIVDTLLAIGMNIDAIEEGIEKNADKWREHYMETAFYNLYHVPYDITLSNQESLEEPSEEHYEKWLKLRLYEYYIEHKDSVDKYGKVLPEMKMTESEVMELKKWLEVAHEERMKQIEEFKNKISSSNVEIPEIRETDYHGLTVSEQAKTKQKTAKTDKQPKLDLKTRLYLYSTKAIKTEHEPVVEVEEKRTMPVKDSQKNEVYIFKNHDEYRRFFLMYLDDINDEVIDLAIYARGSKGQIVALKGLCEHIIVKKKVNDFYCSITQEQIDEIHSKGKLTPLEIVELWESYDLCVEGNKTTFSNNRCQYFNQNCHECLMETASHELEHDNIDFSTVNPTSQSPALIKIKK